MHRTRLIFYPVAAVLMLSVFFVTGGAVNIFKNDFEQQWENLSKDVGQLNEYTKSHPTLVLRKVKIGNKTLNGAIFSGSTFENVEWEGTSIEEATFIKTVFKNCKFIGSQHWNSKFTDVIFENCTFSSAEFSGSIMVNVRFEGCKITDSRLKELTGNELILEDCVLEERASLAWSSIPMLFLKCTLDGVGLSGMKQPNTMIVEDCLLDEVDFSRGYFSDITLRRVRQGEGGIKFNGVAAENIRLENVELDGIGFMEARAKTAVIVDSEVLAIGFSGGGVRKLFSEILLCSILI